jgi:N6-L-threonylcarbamoyladenine synthase
MLAIESSCDETAAAIVDEQYCVRSSIVASQAALHARFAGVVPEIASRAHLERILPVIDEALSKAGCTLRDLSVIAAVTGPGLVGSLLVGLTAAKTLAWTLGLPLVGVDHIEAHLFACQMSLPAGQSAFPAVGLVVSGGHTNLYDCHSASEMDLLGSTIDDAAGEAFDKAAAVLGLAYPGGPAIEAAAKTGSPEAFAFPRSFIKERERLAFSFSGLKTALLYEANGLPGATVAPPQLTPQRIADLAASFQQAVVDVLVEKCRHALPLTGRQRLLVGGGVAANSLLRECLDETARADGFEVIVSEKRFCTDNAAMAAVGWERFHRQDYLPLGADVRPGLVRKTREGATG